MYLHFVSHTHWDREWYETFDAFRFRLVRLIDHLLDVFREEPAYRYFLLDGQTIVLEDYVEVNPARQSELKSYIEGERLFVGPWYVLTDEFLVSGETHIRNLLLGRNMMRAFGGDNRVGYLPDSFGHIAQMPQILIKSGIPHATFWRGAPKTVQKSEFFWQAPDGSKVLTLYMPFGYGIATDLPDDEEKLMRRIGGLVEKLTPFATTSHLLLMNGSDHVEPDPKLPQKLDLLRKRFPEHVILHSHLGYLFRKIEEEAPTLSIYEGEWRADDLNYLLGGTLSTRVYLKQKHHQCSSLLEGWLEPLYTVISLLGGPYPEEYLAYLWKLLLQNSPHDSICGCSIDAVHEEMMLRYRKIETLGGKLLEEARDTLEKCCRGDEDILLIFNPYPYPVDAYLEGEVYLQKAKIREVDFEVSKIRSYEPEEGALYRVLELQSREETVIPEIIENDWVTFMATPSHTLPQIFRAQRLFLGFTVHHLPPLGFRAYRIVPKNIAKENHSIFPQRNVLENEFYRIVVEPSGCLRLFAHELSWEGVLGPVFEDGADAGDEYDYSPCENDEIIHSSDLSPAISWVRKDRYLQSVRLHYSMTVPRSLTPDRKGRSQERVVVPITMDVRLYSGSRRIDLDIGLENTARDHRLRILFDVPFRTAHHFVDAHFAILQRENDGKSHPQNDFVFVEDGEKVFALFNQGLREYEVSPEEKGTRIAVTLLRAVGWLSRDDLLTRKGDAGWSLPAEGAQCLGNHRFRLALLFAKGPAWQLFLNREARIFNRPPLLLQVEGNEASFLNGWSPFECDNPVLVLSALKRKENGDGMVIRMYNPTVSPQRFRLSFTLPVIAIQRLSLVEEEEDLVPLRGNVVEGVMGPFEIATWGIVLRKERKGTFYP
ncbi:MAG: glycoside hydrolase family 38 C-terminal domain-containing protein [Atribacterota bacterium]